jgi:opacity protein-like surface antigen
MRANEPHALRPHGLTFRSIAVTTAVVTLVSLAIAPPLDAQTREPGRRASFTAGASFGDGETALALSAGLGFHLSPRLGLEFELAYARKLDFTLDLCPSPRVCVLGGQVPVTGRTVSLVPHLVVELSPGSRRLRVYAQAGAGAGHVRQRYFIGPPLTNSLPEPVEFTRSKVVVAFSLGGGAAVQISQRLSVGVDLRSLHLLDEEANLDRFITPSGTLSTLRVGSRISWRF